MLVLEVGDLFRHFISGTGTGTLITMIPLITFIINPKGGRWWWWGGGEGRGGAALLTALQTFLEGLRAER